LGASLAGHLEGVGGGSIQTLVAMDLFDEGADQGLPVEADLVFTFDLGEDFGDMEGFAGLSEYVNSHVHIRHTFIAFSFCFCRFGVLQLFDDPELGRKQRFIEIQETLGDFVFHRILLKEYKRRIARKRRYVKQKIHTS